MLKAKNFLKEAEKKVKLITADTFDPQEFYKKDREGLYVWTDFKNRIVAKATVTPKDASFEVLSFDLVEAATDEEIEKALPKDYLFSESDVCAVIAELIEKQSKGEEGVLVNTGYANLFYTTSFVVSVFWLVGEWDVNACRRGGSGWRAGPRVFSPAN